MDSYKVHAWHDISWYNEPSSKGGQSFYSKSGLGQNISEHSQLKFDVLLTMHLSIILVINQLNVQISIP